LGDRADRDREQDGVYIIVVALSPNKILNEFEEALYEETGETDRAFEYCDRALELAIELGVPLAKECEELKQQLKEEHNGGNG
jgi:hypothetical protein